MNRPEEAVASRCVLYIGGVEADARMIREALAESRLVPYDLEWAANFADGIERLASSGFSAILLDLGLLRAQDIGNLGRVEQAFPQTPILLVGSDVEVSQQTGDAAPYCLVKRRLDGYWLPRVLHDAIERRQMKDALLAGLERAQVTLNSIGEAVISTNNSGKITYFNAAAEALTAWRRAEAIGRSLQDVIRIGGQRHFGIGRHRAFTHTHGGVRLGTRADPARRGRTAD
jgi:PAS domain-containing protein